jgi:hypothetical protein
VKYNHPFARIVKLSLVHAFVTNDECIKYQARWKLLMVVDAPQNVLDTWIYDIRLDRCWPWVIKTITIDQIISQS